MNRKSTILCNIGAIEEHYKPPFVHRIHDFEVVNPSRSVRPSTVFLSAGKKRRTCQGYTRDF